MIGSVLGPATEAAFIASIAHGDFTVVDLTSADWRRVAELVERYADLNLGTVDAAVVATAERLNLTTIATINPRDFRVVRPAHCDAFELVP
jgi:predicted nucleic acid-binding protein